jgi:hypothetical protein
VYLAIDHALRVGASRPVTASRPSAHG